MFPKGSTERIYQMHVLYYPWILIDSGSPKESLKNKYENIHPNRNSPSRNYPPGNKHVPLLEKENHWLKSGSVRDMWSFPGGWCLFLLVEDLFFCNRRSTWRCKTLPPGMVVIIGIMKQGNEVAIPPEARNLQGGSSHDWSLQIKPFKTGLLSLSKEIQRERERDNWQ